MPARLIEYLAVSGARDSTGAAVASGTVNFYEPGTLTPVAVYSDDGASLTITQPITLDAGGRTTCYAIAPVRLIVKDVNGTTVQDISRADGDRAELVWNTATGWTASSVKDAFAALATSLGGTDGKIRPTGGSSDQYLKDWAGNFWVNVKSRGATGDGVTDDTSAVQGAITYLAGLSPAGGVVYFPPGTYLVSGLTVGATSASTGNGITLRGANARAATLKLSSGSADAILITDGDNNVVEDIGFSHSSSTTGAAIKLVGCRYAHINRVYTASSKFAVGVDIRSNTTSSRAIVEVCVSNSVLDCVSSAGNAAVRIGRSSSVVNCQGVTVRDNSLLSTGGSGYALEIEGEVYGILVSGNRIQANGLFVADGTSGTTTFSGHGISVVGNTFFSSKITLAPAVATGFAEYGNNYQTAVTILDSSDGAVWGSTQLSRRPAGFTGTQSAGSGGTFTPDLSKGAVFLLTISGGTTTIANPTNASNKTRGTSFIIVATVSGADQVVAFDTEYKAASISGQPANGTTAMLFVVYDGSNWRPAWFGSTTT